jgi:hypothetical protein
MSQHNNCEEKTGDVDYDAHLGRINAYRDFCRKSWGTYNGGLFHPLYNELGFIIGAVRHKQTSPEGVVICEQEEKYYE